MCYIILYVYICCHRANKNNCKSNQNPPERRTHFPWRILFWRNQANFSHLSILGICSPAPCPLIEILAEPCQILAAHSCKAARWENGAHST